MPLWWHQLRINHLGKCRHVQSSVGVVLNVQRSSVCRPIPSMPSGRLTSVTLLLLGITIASLLRHRRAKKIKHRFLKTVSLNCFTYLSLTDVVQMPPDLESWSSSSTEESLYSDPWPLLQDSLANLGYSLWPHHATDSFTLDATSWGLSQFNYGMNFIKLINHENRHDVKLMSDLTVILSSS